MLIFCVTAGAAAVAGFVAAATAAAAAATATAVDVIVAAEVVLERQESSDHARRTVRNASPGRASLHKTCKNSRLDADLLPSQHSKQCNRVTQIDTTHRHIFLCFRSSSLPGTEVIA